MGEIQYDPVMNGSCTWQIYNGPPYQAKAPFDPGEGAKLALDVGPNSVAVFVGEQAAPRLVIPNLQLGRSTGRIGVWGYLPGYIRKLTIREKAGFSVPAVSAADRYRQLSTESLRNGSLRNVTMRIRIPAAMYPRLTTTGSGLLSRRTERSTSTAFSHRQRAVPFGQSAAFIFPSGRKAKCLSDTATGSAFGSTTGWSMKGNGCGIRRRATAGFAVTIRAFPSAGKPV